MSIPSYVITGTSTGIGRAAVVRLAAEGARVFATVRRPEDADALRRAIAGELEVLLLDVTDAAARAAAADAVAAAVGDDGLQGLVNNAGIAEAGPLEFLPVDTLRHQLEVNVTAQVAMTQVFLPLLRQGGGRIVNVGSIGGRSVMPFAGAYCASKYALEAVTDALRMELKPWGLEVIIVEPGNIATPIWEKGAQHAVARIEAMPDAAHRLYGGTLDTVRAALERMGAQGEPSERVADVIHHALTARRPKTRYLIGRMAHVRMVLQKLPDRLRDRIILRGLSKG